MWTNRQSDVGCMTGRMHALRGAVTVEGDTAEAIAAGAAGLLQHLMRNNRIEPADVVSIVFTATPDLTAEFPAAGARRAGLIAAPVLSAVEVDVPGSLPRCIRVLIHFYSDLAPDELRPSYLGDARALRQDLDTPLDS